MNDYSIVCISPWVNNLQVISVAKPLDIVYFEAKKSGITGPRLAQSPSISALVLVVFSQFFDTFRILSTKFDRRTQLKSHFCDHIILKRFREILASCQRHWTLLTWHTTLVLMPATRLACHWRVLCLLFLRRATVIRHYTSLSYHSHVSTDWH